MQINIDGKIAKNQISLELCELFCNLYNFLLQVLLLLLNNRVFVINEKYREKSLL
jgi:hypothetical protein